MKILYLISTMKDGIGGHYYSFKTTIQALNGVVDPYLVNIGLSPSPIFDSIEIKKQTLLFKNFNLISIIQDLKKIIVNQKIECIHAFDDTSYLFARVCGSFLNIPSLVTKCGGPVPKTFFPYSDNIILYSEEDMHYFKTIKKFKQSNLFLIPNRISPFESDLKRIDSLKNNMQLPEDKVLFLRISRLSKQYVNSLIQSIELVDQLNKDGIGAYLVIIGSIESTEVHQKLLEMQNSNIKIITASLFTHEAKQLIDIADFVIATGRSLMEAASKKKILLTPIKKYKYPIMIDNTNFQSFFQTNFSERNSTESSNEQILDNIKVVVQSEIERRKLKEFSYQQYEHYFNINSVLPLYENIYENIIKSKKQKGSIVIDTITHILKVLVLIYKVKH